MINTMCKKRVFKINIQDCKRWQEWQEGLRTAHHFFNFCISLFAYFDATMAFLLECCTALVNLLNDIGER